MTWLVIGLLFIVCVLLVVGISKQGRISDLEMEILLLKEEREALTVEVNSLHRNIENIKTAYEEVTKIEEKKKENKVKKSNPPPTGDSASRLDRLNKLSDKSDGQS